MMTRTSPVAEITCEIRAYETAGLRRPIRKARDQGILKDIPRGAQHRESGCIGVRKRKGFLRHDTKRTEHLAVSSASDTEGGNSEWE